MKRALIVEAWLLASMGVPENNEFTRSVSLEAVIDQHVREEQRSLQHDKNKKEFFVVTAPRERLR